MIRTVLRDRFRRVWVILAGMTALFSVEAVVIMIHDGIAVSGCVLTPHRLAVVERKQNAPVDAREPL
jgi:hypothetical protein